MLQNYIDYEKKNEEQLRVLRDKQRDQIKKLDMTSKNLDFNLSICEKKLHDIKIAKEEARKIRNQNHP